MKKFSIPAKKIAIILGVIAGFLVGRQSCRTILQIFRR